MIDAHGTIWPIVVYKDAPTAINFLIGAFGFEMSAVYLDDHDESVVVHAELRWPAGGGIMVGSQGAGQPPFTELRAGWSAVHLVTSEPAALYARAKAGGARVARELSGETHGSTGFTAWDPEGNIWSFGTYAGE